MLSECDVSDISITQPHYIQQSMLKHEPHYKVSQCIKLLCLPDTDKIQFMQSESSIMHSQFKLHVSNVCLLSCTASQLHGEVFAEQPTCGGGRARAPSLSCFSSQYTQHSASWCPPLLPPSLTSQSSPMKELVSRTPPLCHVFSSPFLLSVTFARCASSSLEPVRGDSAASPPGRCRADRERGGPGSTERPACTHAKTGRERNRSEERM